MINVISVQESGIRKFRLAPTQIPILTRGAMDWGCEYSDFDLTKKLGYEKEPSFITKTKENIHSTSYNDDFTN
jgi:hypothetical protein